MANENDISGKVGLDITDFKSGVAQLNREIKVIESGFQAAAAGTANWTKDSSTLQARIDSLNQIMELQRKKVDATREAYEKVVEEKGRDSKAAQDLEIKLNNEVKALNQSELALKNASIALDNLGKESDDARDELDKAGKQAREAGDAAEKSGKGWDKLSGILKGVGVAAGAAAVAAGVAAVSIGKQVVQSFGELEQNLGGSEAVFGEYAAKIQKTGEDAYKNLGVSQSEYLAIANKMGALFQGSGVEQQKSLELTEKAMQRAADMASVMGIDMKTALDSVAGAAKGNYTMMDNLGVAMNETTLKAYALSKGLNYGEISKDQSAKAELAMQMFFDKTEQYAGNFARESTETVTGSLGLLQAALGSFVAGLGNADADMHNLTANLVDAFQAVIKNVTPIVENLAKALPDAFEAMLPAIKELLPVFLMTTTDLFEQILNTLISLLPELIPAAVQGVMTIVNALIDNLPLLIDATLTLVLALADGIIQALPELIPAAVQIIVTLAVGLIEALPRLIAMLPQIFVGIRDGLAALDWGEIGKQIIEGIKNGVITAAKALASAVVDAAKSALKAAKNFLGISSPSRVFREQVGAMIGAGMAQGITDSIPAVNRAMDKLNQGVTLSTGVPTPSVQSNSGTAPTTVAAAGKNIILNANISVRSAAEVSRELNILSKQLASQLV